MNLLVRININRVVAIVFTLLLTIVISISLVALLFSQASRFSESWPLIAEKFAQTLDQALVWSTNRFGINPEMILNRIEEAKGKVINVSADLIKTTVVKVGNGFVVMVLIPVYIFLFLYYKSHLLEFIHKLAGKNESGEVRGIVLQVKTIIQRYLVGLLIEASIVAAMDISVLLILGIDYAIIIGIIGAFLNMIPYIGGLVAVAIPMMIALATKSTAWYAIYVLVGYYVIQLIDNNIIVPKIVASKVKINALFSIIVVIAGNALWGVPGMFLSLPLLAIVKLIFDHIKSMEAWGFLLGDTMPSIIKSKSIRLKPKKN